MLSGTRLGTEVHRWPIIRENLFRAHFDGGDTMAAYELISTDIDHEDAFRRGQVDVMITVLTTHPSWDSSHPFYEDMWLRRRRRIELEIRDGQPMVAAQHWYAIAKMHHGSGDLDESLKAFNSAVEHDPLYP